MCYSRASLQHRCNQRPKFSGSDWNHPNFFIALELT